MAVGNPWFWVLLGCGVVLVAVAAALLCLRGRNSLDELPGRIGKHEVLMYLNETLVATMRQYDDDVGTLRKEVENYRRSSVEGGGDVKIRWFGANTRGTREGTTTESYTVEEQLITSVRRVVEQLEKADAIVHADFATGEVEAHPTFADTAADVRLSATLLFLSITGKFTLYQRDDIPDPTYLRLRAPYPPDGTGRVKYVQVKIARSGIPGSGLSEQAVLTEANASFRGRVLGKAEEWDEQDGVLKMWALAIFR